MAGAMLLAALATTCRVLLCKVAPMQRSKELCRPLHRLHHDVEQQVLVLQQVRRTLLSFKGEARPLSHELPAVGEPAFASDPSVCQVG